MKHKMKHKIKGMFLVVMLMICSINTQVLAEDIPDELKNLYAQSAVLMDADSGRILFGKNEKKVLPMASTTKIMTCIVALENMRGNQICTISDYAASQPKVHLGAKSGEKFYMVDLLYSMMLESHNDSAVTIAETIGGSVDDFAKMMNRKAMEIGCTDTYFITPNGLDAKDAQGIHSTTATDLARIMLYCIQKSSEKERFLEITRTESYQFTDVSGKRKYNCYNHNAFLGMMDGALSGKTGFTNDAGYCYVGALRQGERTFIVSLLACGWPNNKGYKWKDTKKLMQYALENYKYCDVMKKMVLPDIPVTNGINQENPFCRQSYVKVNVKDGEKPLRVLIKEDEKITVKVIVANKLAAPINEQEKVGAVYYVLDNYIISKREVITDNEVKEKSFRYYLELLCDFYMMNKNIRAVNLLLTP